MTDKHEVIPHADTVPARTIMHPLVEKMLGANPTPEALEKILALQREWEEGEAKRAYTAALTELKRDLPPWLSRDKTVDFHSKTGGNVHYTHTSLAGAMQTVLPHLTHHGFSLTWKPGKDQKGEVTVTARLSHRLGHSEEATLSAPPDMSGSKSTAQGIASTITLLQRYSALAILGLATADMVEPVGEPTPTPERVDTARNMKAVAAIVKAGKSKDDAEKHVGKPLAQWTAADLESLRAWITSVPATTQEPSPAVEAFDVMTVPADKGGDTITLKHWQDLKTAMHQYHMSGEQMALLIEHTFGQRPLGLHLLKRAQYVQLSLRFGRVREGEITLDMSQMRFVEPPDAE